MRGVRSGSALIVDCPPRRVNLLRISDFRLVNLQGVSVKRHLFNWRLTPRAYKRMRRFLKNWLPVLVWLGVIFLGSTDLFVAQHTSGFIFSLFAAAETRHFTGEPGVDSLHCSKGDASERIRRSDVAFAPRRGLHDKSQTVDTDPLLECLGCLRIGGCHG